jgi:thiamine-phosphate pyrophosphorylase
MNEPTETDDEGLVTRSGALRIVDAARNRAAEGLRTIEDYGRFVLEDPALYERLKGIRHHLDQLLQAVPRQSLLQARDTAGDVGTSPDRSDSQPRRGVMDVVAAASQRVQQAIRSVEEYGKVIAPRIGAELEQLRYQAYQVLAQVELAGARRARLEQSLLYVLVDAKGSDQAFVDHLAALFQSGVDIVQLRDKEASDRVLLHRARAGMSVARQAGGLLLVNDRCDVAALAQAHGAHVGQDELPVRDARRLLGGEPLIGLSTHSVPQALEAVADRADYIGVGPTFPSRTKSFERFTGVGLLAEVVAQTTIPAFAIGGIDESNLEEVLAAGIRRVAVSGAIEKAADPYAAARRIKARLMSDPRASQPRPDRSAAGA